MSDKIIDAELKIETSSEGLGRLRIADAERSFLEIEGLCEFEFGDVRGKIKIDKFSCDERKATILGASESIKCVVDVTSYELCWDFRYMVINISSDVLVGRIKIIFDIVKCANIRWLIPGIFYKDNSAGKSIRRYPKFARDKVDIENLISNYWSFSSRRASMPVIFCWCDDFTVAILTNVEFSHGESALFFYADEIKANIGLIFPYSEEPISYIPFLNFPLVVNNFKLCPGESVNFSFKIFISDSDIHCYNKIVREFYRLNRDFNLPKPWFSLEEGAEISAFGLYRWHYVDEYSVLYETRGFDNVLSLNARGYDTRPNMHIAWISGVPYAYSLLRYGYIVGNMDYVRAGIKVIDKIVNEGASPAGILWSQWTKEKGWSDGWNPKDNLTQARTLSEAILFLIRAYKFESERGIEHKEWRNCIFENLNYALKVQNEDGNFGSYYNSITGEVEIWDGCAGLLWVAVLSEAYKVFREEKFKVSAKKAGGYYSKFVLDEFIYGAPEDAFMVPTSEDTYNALISYVLLYEIDSDGFWLELARRSADLMMTFRFPYNLKFKEHTILNAYDFRTIGGDIASPLNQHLHNYGLMCIPEILKLYKFTGDDYYLDRTIDNICFSLQFIARDDGDFNAFKGMMSEQFYYVDWLRPSGTILALSHAWCLGMIIYAFISVFESKMRDLIFEQIKKYVR